MDSKTDSSELVNEMVQGIIRKIGEAKDHPEFGPYALPGPVPDRDPEVAKALGINTDLSEIELWQSIFRDYEPCCAMHQVEMVKDIAKRTAITPIICAARGCSDQAHHDFLKFISMICLDAMHRLSLTLDAAERLN